MIVDVGEGEVEEIPIGLIEVVEVRVIIILIGFRAMNNVEPSPQKPSSTQQTIN